MVARVSSAGSYYNSLCCDSPFRIRDYLRKCRASLRFDLLNEVEAVLLRRVLFNLKETARCWAPQCVVCDNHPRCEEDLILLERFVSAVTWSTPLPFVEVDLWNLVSWLGMFSSALDAPSYCISHCLQRTVCCE